MVKIQLVVASVVKGLDVDHKRTVHGNSEPIDHCAFLLLNRRKIEVG